MFVTRERFDRNINGLNAALREQYWEMREENRALRAAHQRLLEHLGLYEHTRKEAVLLVSKSGPERGD